jgi:heterodisulfide reductase subunit C
MSNYSAYDLERTQHEFKQHDDHNAMEDLLPHITQYFMEVKHQYPDEKFIMEKLMELFSEGGKGQVNRCIECGIDMGECNPRQFCGKWQCDNM